MFSYLGQLKEAIKDRKVFTEIMDGIFVFFFNIFCTENMLAHDCREIWKLYCILMLRVCRGNKDKQDDIVVRCYFCNLIWIGNTIKRVFRYFPDVRGKMQWNQPYRTPGKDELIIMKTRCHDEYGMYVLSNPHTHCQLLFKKVSFILYCHTRQ